ncbi:MULTISPECIES: hypothetical protein [unclassified Mesorhizobium]|uniref:hypothetical protein n=1 Tax=unclassified Mesorhizobium TaxID=325217 RepID=UPI001CCE724B|nr:MULTISPECIES: hypothetical protein [unclassified Mesorhizobium]MBZ9739916.1 hypothetical protein [Mesorhizobium sp. CO1-1-4]MBZ9805729.1 hypothetical protein [Mesorhizobium sp. ES1-6]
MLDDTTNPAAMTSTRYCGTSRPAIATNAIQSACAKMVPNLGIPAQCNEGHGFTLRIGMDAPGD